MNDPGVSASLRTQRSNPVVHDLKSWCQNFEGLRWAAFSDIVYSVPRRNDRDFQAGDLIVFREWAPQPPYINPCRRYPAIPGRSIELNFYTGDEWEGSVCSATTR
jgi:hypothetical protein